MKNLSVSKKILMGFMIVIALIAVILGLTIVTSFSRNSDLQAVNTISKLQLEANDMLDEFNLARVEIRVVFTTVNNDSEYNLAMEYLESASGRVNALREYTTELQEMGYNTELIQQLPGINDQLDAYFQQVENGLVSVSSNDTIVLDTVAEMASAGTYMTETLDDMFDMANNVILNNSGDAEMISGYMTNLMIPLQQMKTMMDEMRISNRDLMLMQDTSVVESVLAQMDALEALNTQTRSFATTDAGRAGFDAVSDALATYRGTIEHMVEVIEDSDITIADTRAVFLELSDLINSGVDALSTEAQGLIDSTIATSMSTMLIMIAVAVASVVVAFIVAFVIARIITKPVNLIMQVADQVGGTGSFNFSEDFKQGFRSFGESKDELGRTINSFAAMMDSLIIKAGLLERVADGDLTMDVPLSSPEDTMGNAMHSMVDNLNTMFGEIKSVAEQVGTASAEIATGAQTLAQGSTEQASTVEEISASINEVTEQANVSVETAMAAAKESDNMRTIAQEGNEKMGRLSGAVQEMSDASQSIGNVIKVIDDIAFQTNILALNAAVEAARAGEHGKGFAVVADEVRNLAGKSAEAAKETSGLISANIEKSELGLQISEETAESLKQIVDGVEKTTEQLNIIAQQSEQSKSATQQVNLAVDQVAQVVQQNSATSEESAAASEEMSSQAQVLQQLVSRFKLKGHTGSARTNLQLPPAGDSEIRDMTSNIESDKQDIIF